MKSWLKYLVLLVVGGAIYCGIEILWRGHTHAAMAVVGGVCFLICGEMNEMFLWDIPLEIQMLLCCGCITWVELLSGIILNLGMGLAIWDYSNMPLNLWGQICLPYMVLWYFLSAVGIILDDWLRYWWFDEERPHYTL